MFDVDWTGVALFGLAAALAATWWVRRGEPRVFVVSVEGNIAAGKSTYIRRVGEALAKLGYATELVCEPIDEWKAVGVNCVDMLAASYADPASHAFPFQLTALATHIRCARRAVERARARASRGRPAIVLVERSPCSYKRVFAHLAIARGTIRFEHAAVYDLLYSVLGETMPPVDLVVYLRADPALCLYRRSNRGRVCESGVDQTYLASLNTLYSEVIARAAKIHQVIYVDVRRELSGLIDESLGASVSRRVAARLVKSLGVV